MSRKICVWKTGITTQIFKIFSHFGNKTGKWQVYLLTTFLTFIHEIYCCSSFTLSLSPWLGKMLLWNSKMIYGNKIALILTNIFKITEYFLVFAVLCIQWTST